MRKLVCLRAFYANLLGCPRFDALDVIFIFGVWETLACLALA